MADNKTQGQHQGTTAAQRQHILKQADAAANGQSRTQPRRTH